MEEYNMVFPGIKAGLFYQDFPAYLPSYPPVAYQGGFPAGTPFHGIDPGDLPRFAPGCRVYAIDSYRST